ncbi:hypothetical protein IV203_025654 [Nitzschia inconspicua]|uniref:Uncharacterized protein n=1 Tax=Nitzschia inconspicua TaxID=303405 RepID=A0A9K3LH99_9STRA|nr:hypothetical protein IV203_025654 [Nitzschia inconspicua]
MIKNTVTAMEVNRSRRPKSYITTKSVDKERLERRHMIKQILDESDHQAKHSYMTESSDDEDDYLTKALSIGSASSPAPPGKRGSASPQINARKDARKTSTPTLITRKKSILSSTKKELCHSESSTIGSGDACSISTDGTSSTIRRRGSRGDLYNYETSQHSASQSEGSHHQLLNASTTPRMRRRKSSRGDMPNDCLPMRRTSSLRDEQYNVPPPPPSQDSSTDKSKSSLRKGRRRSCRGDIVMDNIQCNVDDTSVSLTSLSLVSGSSNLSENGSSVPRQIVERRRSCRGDMAMDHFLSTEHCPNTSESSSLSIRGTDIMNTNQPRRASSFGPMASAPKMARRMTESHAPSISTGSESSTRSRKNSILGSGSSKPRRRLSLGLRKSADEEATKERRN